MDFSTFCRGVLAGGLIGDCYGYLYEKWYEVDLEVPVKCLQDSMACVKSSKIIYSDDTQMGWGILNSLRSRGRFDPQDVVREFYTNFFTDGGHRYYGKGIHLLCYKWKESGVEHPYDLAERQFDGSGSYGNGGAMRISPVTLYGMNMPEGDFEKLVVDITRLTHTHPLGICGALVQAFAVRQLWHIISKPGAKLDPNAFVDSLVQRLRQVQYSYLNFQHPGWKDAYNSFSKKFGLVKELLSKSKDISKSKVVKLLGNDLCAINSVPTAIYVFLRSLRPISGIPFESIPLRCLAYAISLGGDTDTIGNMACSLAGGFTGLKIHSDGNDASSPIPPQILSRCEGMETINEKVEWLSSLLTS
ncbi:unnamed protein product [Calicophoron daubneyi]|uniref:ADP-ribosylhydrolase ARH3 n=1 Tax=Calicophoron daubneyi TaxID=300641 RepID=A0AAV2T2C9_CALDB